MAVIYGLCSILLIAAAVVLRDRRGRRRPPERRGIEVIGRKKEGDRDGDLDQL